MEGTNWAWRLSKVFQRGRAASIYYLNNNYYSKKGKMPERANLYDRKYNCITTPSYPKFSTEWEPKKSIKSKRNLITPQSFLMRLHTKTLMIYNPTYKNKHPTDYKFKTLHNSQL